VQLCFHAKVQHFYEKKERGLFSSLPFLPLYFFLSLVIEYIRSLSQTYTNLHTNTAAQAHPFSTPASFILTPTAKRRKQKKKKNKRKVGIYRLAACVRVCFLLFFFSLSSLCVSLHECVLPPVPLFLRVYFCGVLFCVRERVRMCIIAVL
jgi:hypothetical protein